jgi:hypothetical protein
MRRQLDTVVDFPLYLPKIDHSPANAAGTSSALPSRR